MEQLPTSRRLAELRDSNRSRPSDRRSWVGARVPAPSVEMTFRARLCAERACNVRFRFSLLLSSAAEIGMKILGCCCTRQQRALLCLIALAAGAADYPAPNEGDWIARDFRFHTGEVMPELRLHYTTHRRAFRTSPCWSCTAPPDPAPGMLTAALRRRAVRRRPAARCEQILHHPAGRDRRRGSRPSRPTACATKFPRYNYDDMVAAQYRLVTEGLGIRHLRLVLGNSMGGMHTWIWGVNYPDFMDALVPMASQPTEMSGRNWMMRRMLIDAIRNDPDWNNGDYTTQPRALQVANVFLRHRHQSAARRPITSWRPRASRRTSCSTQRLAAPFTADANDFLYQWDASRDYNPAPGLERIQAALLGHQLRRRRTQSARDSESWSASSSASRTAACI